MIYLFVAYTRLVTFWTTKSGTGEGRHRAGRDRTAWDVLMSMRPCPGPGARRAGANAARGVALGVAVVLDLPMVMLPATLFITMIIYTGWAEWWIR